MCSIWEGQSDREGTPRSMNTCREELSDLETAEEVQDDVDDALNTFWAAAARAHVRFIAAP